MQNKYEVIGIVGEGAYGIVYKCRNKETKEFVAIKKFKESEDEIVKKTMRRELKVLQILKNENIVEFKEAFKRKGNLFLVFEFVERNLLELLDQSPNGLNPKLIKNIIYQLCKAVKYLHSQNIIHRDIKPENLLIDNKMNVKLCDFGFARKIVDKYENLTDYVATRWYRSPELLITGGVYGPEVDYWAIGCIMGELSDGKPLFPGENEIDQLHCIQKVLGNLPEDQIETFYNNPLYAGKSLLNIERPETLEKIYMGVLPKVAISFMKGLLELDPNKRLCGDKVFEHPYFESFKEEEEKKRQVSQEKQIKTKIQNSNTTNINIINYNTYNNNISIASNSTKALPTEISISKEKEQKTLSLQKAKKMNNIMAMTMTNNFPHTKGMKQHSISQRESLNASKDKDLITSFNYLSPKNKDLKNINEGLVGYKTFYNIKKDKYNFSINTNFNSNYNSNHYKGSPIISEEAEYKQKKKSLNTLNTYADNYKYKNIVNHFSPPNKNNWKSNSPKHHNKNKNNTIILPALKKNNNIQGGYYANLKKFQQMINK